MKNFLFSLLALLAFTTSGLAKKSLEKANIKSSEVLLLVSIDKDLVIPCSFLIEVIDRDGNPVDRYEYAGNENEYDCRQLGLEIADHMSEAYPDFSIKLTMYPI